MIYLYVFLRDLSASAVQSPSPCFTTKLEKGTVIHMET